MPITARGFHIATKSAVGTYTVEMFGTRYEAESRQEYFRREERRSARIYERNVKAGGVVATVFVLVVR